MWMIKTRGNVQNRFHLAIPSKDIYESMDFYSKLGCKIGRFNDSFCILDFFGSQVVCHRSDEIEDSADVYPRHFGMILEHDEFQHMYDYCEALKINIYGDVLKRYEDQPSEHKTFFIKDPSNNYIEFKTYLDERAI